MKWRSTNPPNSSQFWSTCCYEFFFFQDFPEEIQHIYIYVYNIIQHIITSSLIRFPRSAWISQTKIGRQIMFERIQAMDQKRLMFDEFSDMFNERVSMARISWIIYYIYYINNIYKYVYIYMYWTEGQEKRKWLQHNSNCSQDCPVDVFFVGTELDSRWSLRNNPGVRQLAAVLAVNSIELFFRPPPAVENKAVAPADGKRGHFLDDHFCSDGKCIRIPCDFDAPKFTSF